MNEPSPHVKIANFSPTPGVCKARRLPQRSHASAKAMRGFERKARFSTTYRVGKERGCWEVNAEARRVDEVRPEALGEHCRRSVRVEMSCLEMRAAVKGRLEECLESERRTANTRGRREGTHLTSAGLAITSPRVCACFVRRCANTTGNAM